MNNHDWLVEQFEAHRNHLVAVSRRLLGSLREAEDAVQESWIRLCRSDTSGVENIGGWLTTIVSRVCLDMLRSRKSRREELTLVNAPEPVAGPYDGSDPEHEALLADSVGVAMLVVLDNLSPSERVSFVLHDIFALPYSEIARIIGRNEATTRQLASRARRQIRGDQTASASADWNRKRELVEAFLAAARAGDFVKLLAVLDPEVVLRNDTAFAPAARTPVVHGAEAVAKQFAGRAQGARAVLVNGSVGVMVESRGRLLFVLEVIVKNDRISAIEMIADEIRVQQLELAVMND